MQNLRADEHHAVLLVAGGFGVKGVAQRRALGDSDKLLHQIRRQFRRVARHNQQPVGGGQLQIVGGGTQRYQRAQPLPLARIGKHMRRAFGIFFKVAVGADGDVADLRLDAVDDVVDERFAVPQHQPFVRPVHALGHSAGHNQCVNPHCVPLHFSTASLSLCLASTHLSRPSEKVSFFQKGASVFR